LSDTRTEGTMNNENLSTIETQGLGVSPIYLESGFLEITSGRARVAFKSI
jgi:hypothetical protein